MNEHSILSTFISLLLLDTNMRNTKTENQFEYFGKLYVQNETFSEIIFEVSFGKRSRRGEEEGCVTCNYSKK